MMSVPEDLWRLGQRQFYGLGEDADGVEFLFRVSGAHVERLPKGFPRPSSRARSGADRLALMTFEWLAASDPSTSSLPSIDELQTPVGERTGFSIEGLCRYRWIVDRQGVDESRGRGAGVETHVSGVQASLRGAPVLAGLADLGQDPVENHDHRTVGVTLVDYASAEDGSNWTGIRPAFNEGAGRAGRPLGLIPASIGLDLTFEWCAAPAACARRQDEAYRGSSTSDFANYPFFVTEVLSEISRRDRQEWEPLLRERLIVKEA